MGDDLAYMHEVRHVDVRYGIAVTPAGDPDGAHVPLPKPEPLVRAISAPDHDFIAALYRPYRSPI